MDNLPSGVVLQGPEDARQSELAAGADVCVASDAEVGLALGGASVTKAVLVTIGGLWVNVGTLEGVEGPYICKLSKETSVFPFGLNKPTVKPKVPEFAERESEIFAIS